MPKIDTRFIHGFFQLFAPHIQEEQVITAYVDEPITPYFIKGENFSTLTGQFELLTQKINSLQLSSS